MILLSKLLLILKAEKVAWTAECYYNNGPTLVSLLPHLYLTVSKGYEFRNVVKSMIGCTRAYILYLIGCTLVTVRRL